MDIGKPQEIIIVTPEEIPDYVPDEPIPQSDPVPEHTPDPVKTPA